jgi:hypothetical protein
MNRLMLVFVLLAVVIIAACGPAVPATPPANADGDGDTGLQPRPTPTTATLDAQPTQPKPAGSSYPPPQPSPTPYPDGYPAPAVQPTADPYPAQEGSIWILYPVGVQCSDPSEYKYQTEQDVIAALTAVGITVQQITLTELMVCTACDCPTSTHFRVQIPLTDLAKAEALEWTAE